MKIKKFFEPYFIKVMWLDLYKSIESQIRLKDLIIIQKDSNIKLLKSNNETNIELIEKIKIELNKSSEMISILTKRNSNQYDTIELLHKEVSSLHSELENYKREHDTNKKVLKRKLYVKKRK